LKTLVSQDKDFEDAIQYYCAASNNKIDAIVTRNTADFKNTQISIMAPEEALSLI